MRRPGRRGELWGLGVVVVELVGDACAGVRVPIRVNYGM